MLQKAYRIRLSVLILLSLIVFVVIWARVYYLQVVRHDYYLDQAQRQHMRTIPLSPRRGDILDRNLETLATSYFADTLILDPRKMKEAPAPGLVRDLAEALGQPAERVRQYFDLDRRKILVRKADEELASLIDRIAAHYELPRSALVVEKHSKRVYPKGLFAGQTIGYTTIDDSGDNIGLSGIELMYDDWLKGSYQKTQVLIDVHRNSLAPLDEKTLEATYGNTVVLTLDPQLQMFTQRALTRRIGEVQARGGVAVVMDVKTGEILALASCPDFDPNEFSKASSEQRRNRALTDPIEIGSVMKILTTTLLLDRGLVSTEEMIDCEGGTWYVDGRRIRDSHALDVIPFHEAFAESSNIAMAKMGLRLEPPIYYAGLAKFGLGQKTGVDLPGEGSGIFYPLSKWTRLSRTSLPIGYECGMTAMQVVSAIGAIANGGQRMRPHILREVRSPDGELLLMQQEPEVLDTVASEAVCRQVLDLMEEVVEHGTGTLAQVPGLSVGGKTGTTRKHTPEGEPRKYIASFAGVLPVNDPKVVIYVYVDEPRGRLFYGGHVAGPVFQEIALHAANLLDIEPVDEVAYMEALHADFTAGAARPFLSDELPEEDLPVIQVVDAIDDATSVIPSEPPVEGALAMPEYLGMTMVEALAALEELGLEAQIQGSGVVMRQEPLPGAWLLPDQKPTLIFSHPARGQGQAPAAAITVTPEINQLEDEKE